MSDNDKFIPELHDIGKLIDHQSCAYMVFHWFNIEELRKEGISVPQNKTFEGIQKHHCRENNPYCKNEKEILNDLDIVLLIMADHFASGFSRLEEKTKDKFKKKVNIENKSVCKLWNKNKQADIKGKLISCTKENIEAILDIVTKNDWITLSSKYNELLDIVPEDKMPLNNVISLKTHITLVGKVYRFLKTQVESFESGKIEFFGDKLRSFREIEDLKKTILFKLVFVFISMPKFIARVSDLSFFEILKKQLNKLKEQDQVLFVSPESFLFICGKNEKTEDIKFIKELINLGFRLKTKEVIKPFSELVELPQKLVNNEIKKKGKELIRNLKNERIPEDRKNEIKQEFIENYGEFFRVYEPRKPREIKNLCEVCQQNEAILYNELTDEEKKLVTKEEDGKKIIESLGKYCLNIRKEYEKSASLKPFAKWEDETPRPDALWIKVSLDVDNLIKALKVNYEEYIDSVLIDNSELAGEVKKQCKLRFTWISEFLYEYDRFLDKFYERLKESFEIIKINKDFFVGKKADKGQIKEVINIYIKQFGEYFPEFTEFKDNPPIRLSIVWANVKSPLIEVWREITKAENPVSIVLKNGNKLKTTLETMAYLKERLDLTSKNVSSFLHRLTEMYEHSGLSILPLTELFNERWRYEELYKAISKEDLSVNDILNWYKISKE